MEEQQPKFIVTQNIYFVYVLTKMLFYINLKIG